jgi:hypothetical protein
LIQVKVPGVAKAGSARWSRDALRARLPRPLREAHVEAPATKLLDGEICKAASTLRGRRFEIGADLRPEDRISVCRKSPLLVR